MDQGSTIGRKGERPSVRRTRGGRRVLLFAGIASLLLLLIAAIPASSFAQDRGIWRDALNIFTGPFVQVPGSDLLTREMAMAPVYWLVSVPNYAARGGSPGELARFTSAIGLAILGAAVTLSVINHWAAGLAGQGSNIMTGITRSLGAGLFIVAWPWIFESAVALINSASHALIGNSTYEIGRMLASVVTLPKVLIATGVLAIAAPVTALLVPLFGLVVGILWLLLALSKIALNAGLVLFFVATPLLVALWPLPGFSWITQWGMKAGAAIAVVPLAWALLMAAAVAVGVDNLLADPESVAEGTARASASEGRGAATLNTVGAPLVALALIVMMLKLPGMILRAAGVTSEGRGLRGMLSHVGSYLTIAAAGRMFGGGAPARPRPTQQPNPTPTPRSDPAPTDGGETAPTSPTPRSDEPTTPTPTPTSPSGLPRRGVGADGLPEQRDTARHRAALDAARAAQAGGGHRPEQVRDALNVLHAHGLGLEHSGQLRDQLLQSGDGSGATVRLANASAADGLPREVQEAYGVLAGADAATRYDVASTWEDPRTASPPPEATSDPPAAPSLDDLNGSGQPPAPPKPDASEEE